VRAGETENLMHGRARGIEYLRGAKQMNFRVGFVLMLGVALLVWSPLTPVQAGEADWPAWRGVNRDGKSPDQGLLKAWPEEGPQLLWRVDFLGKGYSNLAVVDGTIYATGDVDDKLVLFAFDLEGNVRWKKEVDDAWTRSHPGSRSTPTIDNGNLYLLSGNGVIACFDAATGELKWSRNAKEFGGRSGGWGYAESVLIHENMAIFKPGGENCIVALDKTTGETIWQSTGFKAGPEYSSCLLVEFEGRPLIVTGTRSGIVCVDARDGSLHWSNPWCANNTANCPTPAYADGYIFWSNGYGKGGICLKLRLEGDKVTADELWTTKDLVCHHGGYIIEDGYIYGNHSGGWTCLKLDTGEQMWFERAVGKGSLCYADGMLFLFGERGGKAGLATFSPEGLELKGTVEVEGSGPSWAHPVVIGGRLYLRYAENLYCFDVKAG
jgi:outer membrane protein assembly factor BamB